MRHTRYTPTWFTCGYFQKEPTVFYLEYTQLNINKPPVMMMVTERSILLLYRVVGGIDSHGRMMMTEAWAVELQLQSTTHNTEEWKPPI